METKTRERKELDAQVMLGHLAWMILSTGLVVLPISVFFRKVFFGLGFLLALLWSFTNIYFLSHVLQQLFRREGGRGGIYFLLLIKFPILYGAGFLVLRTGFFPIESIALGITLFLVFLFFTVWLLKGRWDRVPS